MTVPEPADCHQSLTIVIGQSALRICCGLLLLAASVLLAALMGSEGSGLQVFVVMNVVLFYFCGLVLFVNTINNLKPLQRSQVSR
jgi:hypothetical protein